MADERNEFRPQSASITSIRTRVAGLLQVAAGSSRSGRVPNVVVLAVDGIGFPLAARHWRRATTLTQLSTVFPTTSSAAWLSSLTGLEVNQHGAAGVIVRLPGSTRLVDLLGPDMIFPTPVPMASLALSPLPDNLFGDCRRLGYRPVAVHTDLAVVPGPWRNRLLAGAEQVPGHRLFRDASGDGGGPFDPARVAAEVDRLVSRNLSRPGDHTPTLVWCFIEVDAYIHHHGYDGSVTAFLAAIDDLAVGLSDDGNTVVAYSDHGLTPTRHDPGLADLLAELANVHDCPCGGAGRTRWLYPPPGRREAIRDLLPARLDGSAVEIRDSEEMFDPDGAARPIVGDLLLIAHGEVFVTMPGYTHDHGSELLDETQIPLAVWSAD